MADDSSPAKRRLMNKAVHYLGRYTASRQRLREVLGRFADRKLDAHDAAEVAAAREQVIDDSRPEEDPEGFSYDVIGLSKWQCPD